MTPSPPDIGEFAEGAQKALIKAIKVGTVSPGQVIELEEWGRTPLLQEVDRRRELRREVYGILQSSSGKGQSLGLEFWSSDLREHLSETLRQEYAQIVREQLPDLKYFEHAERPYASIRYSETWDGTAPFRKHVRMSPLELLACRAQLQEMYNAGIIEPSTSPFESPVLMVPKLDAGGRHKAWRIVCDYRSLDKLIVRD